MDGHQKAGDERNKDAVQDVKPQQRVRSDFPAPEKKRGNVESSRWAGTTMDIEQATEQYEAWLAGRTTLIPADLELKHQRMAESPFPFLRATFYRWVQLWPEVCPELASAPAVLSVGDLHVGPGLEAREAGATDERARGALLHGPRTVAAEIPVAHERAHRAERRGAVLDLADELHRPRVGVHRGVRVEIAGAKRPEDEALRRQRRDVHE